MTLSPSVTIQTGCKINLFLHVGKALPSGYHELETFFLPLHTPCDELIITHHEYQNAGHGLQLTCSRPDIPITSNTISKAYMAYATMTGFAPPLSVYLLKKVPHGAGLGGGSANAAGILKYLDSITPSHRKLTMQRLTRIAREVGADVPFFLQNQPAFAKGVGEELFPTDPPFQGETLVLVCPDTHISTAWAFKELDAFREKNTQSQKKVLTSDGGRDISSFAHDMPLCNDFEEIVFLAHPSLDKIRELLVLHGAHHALLSGTGSSLFGIFSTQEQAHDAVQVLRKENYQTFTQTI